MFAGYTFHVHDATSNSSKDNSIFRMDYKAGAARAVAIKKSFARVKRIFEHVMFPGGPKELFLQGEWYKSEGKCAIAGTEMVSPDPQHHFTHQSKFVPLLWCYQQPVALWPYDPLDRLHPEDLRKGFFDVIDRNEDQEAA
jgi:hypothetical protein